MAYTTDYGPIDEAVHAICFALPEGDRVVLGQVVHEVERLAGLVRRYGGHDFECPGYGECLLSPSVPCTCGFREATASLAPERTGPGLNFATPWDKGEGER